MGCHHRFFVKFSSSSHLLNKQEGATEGHSYDQSVHLSGQQKTQSGEAVVDPNSEVIVGEVGSAESTKQDGDDYELCQNYAVEQPYESFTITCHDYRS